LRPDFISVSALGGAVRKGLFTAQQNLAAMSALLTAMSMLVAIYYFWPIGAAVLSGYAAWQHAGGIFRTALVAGFAGGVLSESSLVYIRHGGRWNSTHVENMVFRFVVFFFGGLVVSKFYECQAFWFGDGLSWRVILPKIVVDQFIFSVVWSTTYQTLTFRWQALRYSGSRLWNELDGDFVVERMLPVLVTNWMFWIPGVTLVYSMPLILQMPINIFATAIWSLLLAGLAKSTDVPVAEMGPGLVLGRENSLAEPVE
jgi:hypothetical protein